MQTLQLGITAFIISAVVIGLLNSFYSMSYSIFGQLIIGKNNLCSTNTDLLRYDGISDTWEFNIWEVGYQFDN